MTPPPDADALRAEAQRADVRQAREIVAVLLVVVFLSGCTFASDLFIRTGFLIRCGPVPMSASDCETKKPAPEEEPRP